MESKQPDAPEKLVISLGEDRPAPWAGLAKGFLFAKPFGSIDLGWKEWQTGKNGFKFCEPQLKATQLCGGGRPRLKMPWRTIRWGVDDKGIFKLTLTEEDESLIQCIRNMEGQAFDMGRKTGKIKDSDDTYSSVNDRHPKYPPTLSVQLNKYYWSYLAVDDPTGPTYYTLPLKDDTRARLTQGADVKLVLSVAFVWATSGKAGLKLRVEKVVFKKQEALGVAFDVL